MAEILGKDLGSRGEPSQETLIWHVMSDDGIEKKDNGNNNDEDVVFTMGWALF